MFASTPLGMSYTTEVTPFLVDSFGGNEWPSSTGGSFFIFDGLVLELCRSVPPVRSMVRVFSRLNGSRYRVRLAGSRRSTCVSPSQPRRIPITSQPISLPRYTTDLMTELRPGTSPPPVRMPIRFADMKALLKRNLLFQFWTPKIKALWSSFASPNPPQSGTKRVGFARIVWDLDELSRALCYAGISFASGRTRVRSSECLETVASRSRAENARETKEPSNLDVSVARLSFHDGGIAKRARASLCTFRYSRHAQRHHPTWNDPDRFRIHSSRRRRYRSASGSASRRNRWRHLSRLD